MVLKYVTHKKPGELVSAREICDELKIPFDPTAKVMQIMNANHLLKSHQGKSGGYSLNKELQEISYGQLAEIIEGKLSNVKCISGKCELLKTCNIITPIDKLNLKTQEFYHNLKIGELLKA